MLHMTTGLFFGVKKMGGALEWGKVRGTRAEDQSQSEYQIEILN
jgi:hypothetical protein